MSFLPIREGVSKEGLNPPQAVLFPPYTGGCIELVVDTMEDVEVSSLYGRVYRDLVHNLCIYNSFLPIREGLSPVNARKGCDMQFPPYTGGCINK